MIQESTTAIELISHFCASFYICRSLDLHMCLFVSLFAFVGPLTYISSVSVFAFVSLFTQVGLIWYIERDVCQ